LAQLVVEVTGGGFVRFGVAEEDAEFTVNGGGHGEYFTVKLPSTNKTCHE